MNQAKIILSFAITILCLSFFLPANNALATDLNRCNSVATGGCGGSLPVESTNPTSDCAWQASTEGCCTNGTGYFFISPGAACPSQYPTPVADPNQCAQYYNSNPNFKCCCPAVSGNTSSLCPEDETFLPKNLTFDPQITIPGSPFQEGQGYELKNDTSAIGEYIRAYYQYGLGIVGIAAAIMLMIGGIIWLTAGGSSSKIEQAKDIITSSLIGMFLLFGSWIILRTINPDLVELKTTAISMIEKPTCCEYPNPDNPNGGNVAGSFFPSSCTKMSGHYFPGKVADLTKTKCVDGGCCLRISRAIRPATLVISAPFKAFKDAWNNASALVSGDPLPPSSIFEYSFDAWDSIPETCSSELVSDINAVDAVLSGLFAGFTASDINHNEVFYKEKCSYLMCCVGKNYGDLCLSKDKEPGVCQNDVCVTD
ncbi:MAG TPA: pilin [bacterium]|nr:pilin [bacterium]HPT29745.1 pilin [bacterium]